MSRPWSSLKRTCEDLFVDHPKIQIYTTSFPGLDELRCGRWWITVGKEIIWNFPTQFLSWKKPELEHTARYIDTDYHIADILRTYTETAKDQLLSYRHPEDHWGLADVLCAADRRIGRAKLLEWAKTLPENSPARSVLTARFKSIEPRKP